MAPSSSSSLASIEATFKASIRSIGTAVTLAAVGVYLHRRGFIVGEGKRTLALISQQVTFPLFLFTKIIYCNQDWSADPCPDVTKSLADVWMLLFWPLYVVGAGIAVGALVAKICRTPAHQVRAVLAAVGFGNSTGLCITMLTVVHTNFPSTSDLGRIDPTLFLSVYLLLYPVLQWGVGGWLLAPKEDENDEKVHEDEMDHTTSLLDGNTTGVPSNCGSPEQSKQNHIKNNHKRALSGGGNSGSFRKHVLNNMAIQKSYLTHRRGLSSNDEGLYMSEINLAELAHQAEEAEQDQAPANQEFSHHHQLFSTNAPPTVDEETIGLMDASETSFHSAAYGMPINEYGTYDFEVAVKESEPTHDQPLTNQQEAIPASIARSTTPEESHRAVTTSNHVTAALYEGTACDAISNILNRCFQPPVIGALAGIFVAMISPLRGVFVDIVDRRSHAPLQWLFDGLYSVGLTAVPINMIILGCNLSASQTSREKIKDIGGTADTLLPTTTMIGIVIGKMIVLPIIGITTSLILKKYFWHIPNAIDGSFYLVLMIVFLTPTANNVMVMVELSGSNAKEGIARVIALQYAFAPIILSVTMTIAIGIASNWS